MKQPVHLYGFAPSTYVRTVRLVCAEKSIDYTLEPGGFGSPEFRALHPFGKMPAMRHGDVVLAESLAIASYLDQVFDGPSLFPDQPAPRARAIQWATSIIDYLYPAVVVELLKAMKAETEPSAEVIADAREILGVFDGAVADTGHLVGDRATVADLYLWPVLAFADSQPAGKALLADFRGLSAALTAARARSTFAGTAS